MDISSPFYRDGERLKNQWKELTGQVERWDSATTIDLLHPLWLCLSLNWPLDGLNFAMSAHMAMMLIAEAGSTDSSRGLGYMYKVGELLSLSRKTRAV